MNSGEKIVRREFGGLTLCGSPIGIRFRMLKCAKLETAETPIGFLDTLIAAQAVARKLVLVSNNKREFNRVAGLRIENWAT